MSLTAGSCPVVRHLHPPACEAPRLFVAGRGSRGAAPSRGAHPHAAGGLVVAFVAALLSARLLACLALLARCPRALQASLGSGADPPVFPHSLCFRLCRRHSSNPSSPPAASSLWPCWCRRGRQSQGEPSCALLVVRTCPAAGAAAGAAAGLSCLCSPSCVCMPCFVRGLHSPAAGAAAAAAAGLTLWLGMPGCFARRPATPDAPRICPSLLPLSRLLTLRIKCQYRCCRDAEEQTGSLPGTLFAQDYQWVREYNTSIRVDDKGERGCAAVFVWLLRSFEVLGLLWPASVQL